MQDKNIRLKNSANHTATVKFRGQLNNISNSTIQQFMPLPDRFLRQPKVVSIPTATDTGFSLVEMSIVMVVIGLLIGGMLMPLSVQQEKTERDQTKRTLQDIKEALVGFTIVNGRLPCPDTDDDGLENYSASCTVGTLPWSNLGIHRFDAWKRSFTYRVASSYAGSTITLTTVGDIQVLDSRSGNLLANQLPAVVVSHGKNWALSNSAAINPNEDENDNNDATFVDASYSNINNNEYDDLLFWVSPNILKSRLVAAGQLP